MSPNATCTNRTLDQSYYYMLESTEDRDKSQVVARLAQNAKQEDWNLVMVDQLWAWVLPGWQGIDESSEDKIPETIITCFPNRRGMEASTADSIYKNVLRVNRPDRLELRSSADLVAQIVIECTSGLRKCQYPESLQFCEMFESAIREIVSCSLMVVKPLFSLC